MREKGRRSKDGNGEKRSVGQRNKERVENHKGRNRGREKTYGERERTKEKEEREKEGKEGKCWERGEE